MNISDIFCWRDSPSESRLQFSALRSLCAAGQPQRCLGLWSCGRNIRHRYYDGNLQSAGVSPQDRFPRADTEKLSSKLWSPFYAVAMFSHVIRLKTYNPQIPSLDWCKCQKLKLAGFWFLHLVGTPQMQHTEMQQTTNCQSIFRVLNQALFDRWQSWVSCPRNKNFLALLGWRPRRTIVFCSWGSEEYGIIGSFEWVEVTQRHEFLLAFCFHSKQIPTV